MTSKTSETSTTETTETFILGLDDEPETENVPQTVCFKLASGFSQTLTWKQAQLSQVVKTAYEFELQTTHVTQKSISSNPSNPPQLSQLLSPSPTLPQLDIQVSVSNNPQALQHVCLYLQCADGKPGTIYPGPVPVIHQSVKSLKSQKHNYMCPVIDHLNELLLQLHTRMDPFQMKWIEQLIQMPKTTFLACVQIAMFLEIPCLYQLLALIMAFMLRYVPPHQMAAFFQHNSEQPFHVDCNDFEEQQN